MWRDVDEHQLGGNEFSAPEVVRIATLSRVSTSFFVGATLPKKAQYSPMK